MCIKKKWSIAVVPGDGIGSEVMSATLGALEVLRTEGEFDLTWTELGWPSTAWHQDHGVMMPADGLQQLRGYDAILLGALGDPGPQSDPNRYVVTDGISLAPLLEIRKGFDLWACERPARLFKGCADF